MSETLALTDPEPPVPPRPSMAQIIDAVARRFGVRPSVILSDQRSAEIVRMRWIVMYLAVEMTYCSATTIARYLRRDHSTVAYGVAKLRDLMLRDADLRASVEALLNQLDALARAGAAAPTMQERQ